MPFSNVAGRECPAARRRPTGNCSPHSDEVLAGMGFTPEEIASVPERGIGPCDRQPAPGLPTARAIARNTSRFSSGVSAPSPAVTLRPPTCGP